MEFIFALISIIFLYYFFKLIFSGTRNSQINQEVELSKHLFKQAQKTFENPLSSDSVPESLKNEIRKTKAKGEIFKKEILSGLFLEFSGFCGDEETFNILKKPSSENLPFIRLELNLSRLTNHSLSTKLFCGYLLKKFNKKYDYNNKTGIITDESTRESYKINSTSITLDNESFISIMEPQKKEINLENLMFINSIDRAFILDVTNEGVPIDIYILSQDKDSFYVKNLIDVNKSKIIFRYNDEINHNEYTQIYMKLIDFIIQNKRNEN